MKLVLPLLHNRLVEGFAKRSDIKVRLEIAESPERLSQSCELALFRILQRSSPFDCFGCGRKVHAERQPTSTRSA